LLGSGPKNMAPQLANLLILCVNSLLIDPECPIFCSFQSRIPLNNYVQ
jgi:hypothetical protein